MEKVQKSKEAEHAGTKQVTIQVQLPLGSMKTKLTQDQMAGGSGACMFPDICGVRRHFQYNLDHSAREAAAVATVQHGVLDFPEVGSSLCNNLYQRGRETGDCLCTICAGGGCKCTVSSPCKIAAETAAVPPAHSPTATTSTDFRAASPIVGKKAKKPIVIVESSGDSE